MNFGNFAWLAVIPALGFLIVIHEIGHYWVGRKMGIKIEEFGIGLPPRAKVLFVRKGVPFTLNWLPLGGFVRFAGEESGFDDPNSLASAPPRRRIPVLAAGVIANVLVAMIMFGLIFAIWGYPNATKIAITSVEPYAAQAGFQEDDQIISIDGTAINNDDQVRTIIQTSVGKPMKIVIERNGTQQTITAAAIYRETTQRYQLGIGLGNAYEPINPFTAMWRGVTHSIYLLGDMFLGFAALIGGLIGLNKPPEGGLAGPVGIARITGEVAKSGMREYLMLTAILSLNLALINILPIPALDGSRIVFALIEAVRRKKIPPEREALVHAMGMMLLLGLMVLITVSDVRNIVTGQPAIAPPATTTPVIPIKP